MRTGIYEPYRNHFPLKQSQVPACQQQAPRLPYGAYDPTKAKLRSQITSLAKLDRYQLPTRGRSESQWTEDLGS